MIERELSGCPPGGHRRRYSWRSWSLTVVLVVLVALLAPDGAGASTPRASSAMKSVADLKALIARMIRVPAGMQSFVPEPIEAKLPGPNLILHWGYPAETHKVQTDDGYVLSLFRVPWGRGGDQTKQSRQIEETKQSRQVEETKQPSPVEETKQSSLVDETKQSSLVEETKQPSLVDETKQSRPVVFLQHGLLQTADQWLLRGPGQDLPFLLADLGFDVWMGNFRGCTYCRKHRFLSPRNYKFWDFGWQENALHDLPAMLDYVVAVTGQPNMYYIGHSMGTTSLLALLADRPEYNSRVRAAFLMAPVAYFQHTWGALAAARNTLSYLATSRLVGEAFPKGSGDACKGALSLCAAVYNAGAGSSPKEFNATLFRVLLGHYPAGSSLGQLLHYLQVMVTGEFKKYDYGPKENLARYGRSKPPLFNLKNVVAPVYLNFAEGDPFSPKLDVQRLAKEVPGVKKMMGVRLKDFGHTDHLYAIHSYDLEYKAMIDVMTER